MNREELAIHAPSPRVQVSSVNDMRAHNPPSAAITPASGSYPGGAVSSSPHNHRVYMVRDRPGHIVIRTKTDQPLELVLRETYHPGWQVTIDGQPAATNKMMNEFLGCSLPSGNHDIRFIFKPASFTYGLYLSAFSVVLSLIIALFMNNAARQSRLSSSDTQAGRQRVLTTDKTD
jgi:hypothetical protein